MRKVILAVNTTLDGCLAGPAGELDWMTPDPAMNAEFTADLRAEVDTMIAGRVAYPSGIVTLRYERTAA